MHIFFLASYLSHKSHWNYKYLCMHMVIKSSLLHVQVWSHIPVPGPRDLQSNYCRQQEKSGSEVEMRRATSGKDGEGYCQETLCMYAGGCARGCVAVGGRDGHGKHPPLVVLSSCCLALLPAPCWAARGQPEAQPLSSACRLVGRFLVATGSVFSILFRVVF